MFHNYGDDVQFVLVYVREAHAIDSRSPSLRGPIVEDPISDKERDAVASTCVTELGLDIFPAVIDRIDDRVSLAYGAWPDRFYLVGKDGKIAYAGGQGPFGFKPDEMEDAILDELKKIKAAKKEKGDK